MDFNIYSRFANAKPVFYVDIFSMIIFSMSIFVNASSLFLIDVRIELGNGILYVFFMELKLGIGIR